MKERYLTLRPKRSSFGIDPWGNDMGRMMRNMFRTFDDMTNTFPTPQSLFEKEGTPRFDFYRKDDKIHAEIELPGIDPENVDLRIYEDHMELKADKKQEDETERDDYFCSERYYGSVARSVEFPLRVNPDSARASYRNGVLYLEVAEQEKANGGRKIAIDSGEE